MLQRQRSPAAPCAPYGGSPCSNFSFMRGCAGLKLSDTFARGVGGATARGWSTSQSRLRVAVPTGLFLCDRHTRGSRLESVFCSFAVGSPSYFFIFRTSAVTGGALCAVRWSALFGFSFMRGCASLKWSGACARGAGGAIARDWSCS